MHDLILEIDSILWWAIIAFAILAVALLVLEAVTKKDVGAIEPAEYDTSQPESLEDRIPVEINGEKISAHADATISEYRSAKLRLCACELETLEQLKLVTGLQVEPKSTHRQYGIKRDPGDKKRGMWD